MNEPLSVEKLAERLATMDAIAWKGIVYRSTSPRYATEPDVLSGIGAAKSGGRWNPKGIAAVYCCVQPETALAETFAMQRYFGWPIHEALPRVLMAISVDLQRVLDLTDGEIRQRLQISEKRMLDTDWRRDVAQSHFPLTHLLGQAIFAAGFEGIKVLSATPIQGENLVVFSGNMLEGSELRVLNLEKAP